ncbi:high affinity nitrate transporter 2.5-like [Beta vulgaris subsp. vulgaris]|uniref:high affinity nitrate transporter 2.5-like n=1 Tax=Beta vulgaris subsp. vulgaris TaxID=3555 RepID=UPI0020366778|nr:high affinity nitrate transporter 2.5-like [Beta vulgaris subsp. vulgaris]
MEAMKAVSDPIPKKFALPVDSENKSITFPLFSVAKPHMRAFHLCWIQFFSCFLSTFAAPPLLPIIRDNLNLTANDIGNSGIGSVSGAIFARVAMGAACDLVGPRLASATLTLLTAPAVYLSAVADTPTGYFLMRFFTGFALATFVSTQYWMSSMFSPTVVGQANGQAAGWGNLGGGVAQLVMPLVYSVVLKTGSTPFSAWRISFFIPALFQMGSAFAVMLFGQDLPDGNFHELQKSGDMHKDNASKVLYHGVTNYRSWITALGYGFCFGVELAVNNIVAYYFYDRFNLNLYISGIVGASFGMVNLFSRPIGGGLSDFMAKKFGMRGRLWSWWVVQALSGVLCIGMGLMNTLSGSIAVMIIFSVFVQAAEGLTFGVVPFVSRRSLGVVSGMTGAGGNVGAVITQVIFFRGSQFTTEKGIQYMGYMIIACSFGITSIYFPQWGGMFWGPKKHVTEEDYYLREWDAKEQELGLHHVSMKFAEGSRNERSSKGKSSPEEEMTETRV